MPRAFTDIILRKFPTDADAGFHAKPKLPGAELGRVLSTRKNVKTTEVIALYRWGGWLGGGSWVFTPERLYIEGGFVQLEDLKSAKADGRMVQLAVNHGGELQQQAAKTDKPEHAEWLVNVLEAIIYAPKAEEALQSVDYTGYDPQQVNWLELRDEVLRTLDELHRRFQDGKLTLQEYENAKTDLLARL